MADPAASRPASIGTSKRAQNMAGSFMRAEIILAFGIIAILAFMLVPIPTWILDMGLSVSITFSVLILMTVLFLGTPLEFSSFPTVLLIATTLRLGLNVASTRLILSEGHTGDDAAGEIIRAFGGFIIQDSYVVGGIVFAILVLVNFVVITKVPAVLPKWQPASPLMPCRANKWRLTPIYHQASSPKKKPVCGAKSWNRKAAFSAPWMVRPNSCAAMPLPGF